MSIESFKVYKIIPHFYFFLLHHHHHHHLYHICFVFPPPPRLSCFLTTQYIVFNPPPPPHFYWFPSSTTLTTRQRMKKRTCGPYYDDTHRHVCYVDERTATVRRMGPLLHNLTFWRRWRKNNRNVAVKEKQ